MLGLGFGLGLEVMIRFMSKKRQTAKETIYIYI